MNPMLLAALGSLLRWALAIGAGYLVRVGVWEPADAEVYISALAGAMALALASLGLSLWQKFQARRTLMVALATPIKMSESEAAALAGGGDVPSVMTPLNKVPTTHG